MKNKNEDIIKKIIEIVASAERVEPAYFTSDNKKDKSFCIKFEQMNKDDEVNMAYESYNGGWEFVSLFEPTIKQSEALKMIKIGEDIMISSYIAIILGYIEVIAKLNKILIMYGLDGVKNEHDNSVKVINSEIAHNYFSQCSLYGVGLANARLYNLPKPLPAAYGTISISDFLSTRKNKTKN